MIVADPPAPSQHNVGFVGQYDCPVFDGIFPFCQVASHTYPCWLARALPALVNRPGTKRPWVSQKLLGFSFSLRENLPEREAFD